MITKILMVLAVDEIYPGGSFGTPVYMSGKGDKLFSSALDLDKEIQGVSSNIPKDLENTTFQDGLFLMYTSGTTGLPKSAVIKHARSVKKFFYFITSTLPIPRLVYLLTYWTG